MNKLFVSFSLCIVFLSAHGSLQFGSGQEATVHSCQASPTASSVAKAAEEPIPEALAKRLLVALASQDLSSYDKLYMESLPRETLVAVMVDVVSPSMTEEYVKRHAERRGSTVAKVKKRIMEIRQREKIRFERGYEEFVKEMSVSRKSGFEQMVTEASEQAGIDWRKVRFAKLDGNIFDKGEIKGGNFFLVFSHQGAQFKLLLDDCIYHPDHGWLLMKNPQWLGSYSPFSKAIGGTRMQLELAPTRYRVSFNEGGDTYDLAEWSDEDGGWIPKQKGKAEVAMRRVSLLPDGSGDEISFSFPEDHPVKGQKVNCRKNGEPTPSFQITEISGQKIRELTKPPSEPHAGKPAGVQLTQQDVFGGKFQEVKRKLDQGADPDVILLPKAKKTALHCCCMGGRVNLVKLLLSKGANPNALDNSKMTPLDVLFSPDFKGRAPLVRMAAENQLEIKNMLEKAGGKRNRP
jgi:hypothetical protein